MNEIRKELERQFKELNKLGKDKTATATSKQSTEKTKDKALAKASETETVCFEVPAEYVAEFAEDFKNLSPKWQEFLSKREAEKTKELQGISEKLKGYQWVDDIFQANSERLASAGIKQVREWLEGLAKIDEALQKDPAKTIKAMSIVYGVDGKKALEKTKDTETDELVARICQLERGYKNLSSFLEKQQNESLLEAVIKYGRQTDDNGRLLHPHMQELLPEVIKLLQSGTVPDIATAYEQAMWLSPQTREELIANRINSKVAEAKRAQKAGFSPKGKAKAPERELTLREELEKNMAAFMG